MIEDCIKLKRYMQPSVVLADDYSMIKYYHEIGLVDVMISFESEDIIAEVNDRFRGTLSNIFKNL